MMDLYTGAYFTKSFYMLGNSMNKCFNCSYCRAIEGKKNDFSYNMMPSEINSLFSTIPVAINLFYGDPLLQIENTIDLINKLEKSNHSGPVLIVTKGDFSKFPAINSKLDLHFAFSTFGVNSKYDGGSLETFENNLKIASELPYKYSTEFRPIIRDINDSVETIENVFKISKKYESPIAFCGLQVNDSLKDYLSKQGIYFKQYDGHDFGLKKVVSSEVESIFYSMSDKYSLPVFKKTSCLISYLHSFSHDYNAHYYRPNEMRCHMCVMKDKCLSYKSLHDSNTNDKLNIPFEHEIIYKDNHICSLLKNGFCKNSHPDCRHINGKIIKINQKITSSDLRLIKWLTGYTVDCNFDEIEYISNNWVNEKNISGHN